MLQIFDLKDYPQFIAPLAQWHFAEWSYLHPDYTLDQLAQEMQQYFSPQLLPSMFILLNQQQELLGSASLVAHDLGSRPEFSPWLANVFVHPAYRGQGMGRRLVLFIQQQAQRAGIGELYLFTANQMDFYRSLGWQMLDIEQVQGTCQTIMRLDLSTVDTAMLDQA